MLDPDISTRDALRQLYTVEPDHHSDRSAVDRRRFLQLVGMGAGAGLVAGTGGTLLDRLIPGYDPSAWAAGPIGGGDGVLVILGMFGGNDGLNTVVPFNDRTYYDMHRALAIDGATTLGLDANSGLHPALTQLKAWWDADKLAIVEGVGYPNPDLSHFNSMANWMSARPNTVPTTGWVGRWLDGHLGGTKDLFAAAEIGTGVPLHLIGAAQRGTGIPDRKPDFGIGVEPADLLAHRLLRDYRTSANGALFNAVSQTFVDYLDISRQLAPVIPTDDQLPETDVVKRMDIAARVINANLGLRVLTVGWGDFDSHAGQPPQHGDRMIEFNAAIERFFGVLDPAWLSRVTVMTFSEFGRTPWSNDGAGTDHGTAAPQFVIGANVAGGFYGQRPALAGLGRWDRMPHHVDLRAYYASIIDGWLGGGSADIVGPGFAALPIFARAPGQTPIGATPPRPIVPSVQAPASLFVPVTPTRVADTRIGAFVPAGAIGPGGVLRVKVAGLGGVPASGATAVVANVTAVDATQPMFLTVFPGGTTRPETSNINGGPGRPVPNLVVIGVGGDGFIEVYNSHGSTHCLVDVFGYFAAGSGDAFTPIVPSRLFDTRDGTGVRPGKLGHLEPVDLAVAGTGVIPADATAVVMNLTVTEADAPGFLRLTPTGTPPSETSNVNFFAGDTVPNLAVCRLGDGGKVTLDSVGTAKHALGDVFGYFSGTGGGRLRPVTPVRALDTRDGTGVAQGPIGPDRTITLPIGGRLGIPASATAIVLNVAATNVSGNSFVTVWPDGSPRPNTSNLNVVPGQTIANLVICQLGTGGQLQIANTLATCDVLADILGYFA